MSEIMKAILVCGGTLSAAFFKQVLEANQEAAVFAVDGGLYVTDEAGICPKYLVGDFDTAKQELVKTYEGRTRIYRHPPEKDATDTQLALELAMELGFDEILLLGATGSRMDHTLANVHMLLTAQKAGKTACLLDENNRLTLHEKSFEVNSKDLYGEYLSFLPFAGRVENLTLQGVKYPLRDKLLLPGDSLCISNEAKEEKISVSFTKGLLLMLESRD